MRQPTFVGITCSWSAGEERGGRMSPDGAWRGGSARVAPHRRLGWRGAGFDFTGGLEGVRLALMNRESSSQRGQSFTYLSKWQDRQICLLLS